MISEVIPNAVAIDSTMDTVMVDPNNPDALITGIYAIEAGTTVDYINGYRIVFQGVDEDVVVGLALDGDLGTFLV